MQSFSILSQGGGVSPKAAVNLELSSRELAGRRAGRGYSEVDMGISLGTFIPSVDFASARIASANPNHDVAPAAVR